MKTVFSGSIFSRVLLVLLFLLNHRFYNQSNVIYGTIVRAAGISASSASTFRKPAEDGSAWKGSFSPFQLLQLLVPSFEVHEASDSIDTARDFTRGDGRSSFDDGNVQKVINILQSNIQHWSFIESQLLEPNVNLAMPEIFIPLKHLTATLEVLGNIFYMRDDMEQAQQCLERACPLLELLPASLMQENVISNVDVKTSLGEGQLPSGVSTVQRILSDLQSIITGASPGSTGHLHAPSLHRNPEEYGFPSIGRDGQGNDVSDAHASFSDGCYTLLRSVYRRIYENSRSRSEPLVVPATVANNNVGSSAERFSPNGRKSWRSSNQRRVSSIGRASASSDSNHEFRGELGSPLTEESMESNLPSMSAMMAKQTSAAPIEHDEYRRKGVMNRLFMNEDEEFDEEFQVDSENESENTPGLESTNEQELLRSFDLDGELDLVGGEQVDDVMFGEKPKGSVEQHNVVGPSQPTEIASYSDIDEDIQRRISELRGPFEHLRAEFAFSNKENAEVKRMKDLAYSAGSSGLGLRRQIDDNSASTPVDTSSTRVPRKSAKHGSRKHINQRKHRNMQYDLDAVHVDDPQYRPVDGIDIPLDHEEGLPSYSLHDSENTASANGESDIEDTLSSSTSIIAEDMEVMLRKFVREESTRGQRDLLQVARKYFDELDINFPNMDYSEYAANMDMGQVFLEVMARVSEEGFGFIGPELEEWQEIGISYLASTTSVSSHPNNHDVGDQHRSGVNEAFEFVSDGVGGVRVFSNDPSKQSQVDLLQSLIKERRIAIDELLAGGNVEFGAIFGGLNAGILDDPVIADNINVASVDGFLAFEGAEDVFPEDFGTGIVLEFDSNTGLRKEIAVELAGNYFNAFSLADRNRMLVLSAFDIVHTEPNDPFDLGLGFKLGIMDNDRSRQHSYGTGEDMMHVHGGNEEQGSEFASSRRFDIPWSGNHDGGDGITHLIHLIPGARPRGRRRMDMEDPKESHDSTDSGNGRYTTKRYEFHDKEASASLYEDAISAYDLGMSGIPLRSSVPTLRLAQGDWTFHLFLLFLLITALIVAAAYIESQKIRRFSSGGRQRSRLSGQRGRNSAVHVGGLLQYFESILSYFAAVPNGSSGEASDAFHSPLVAAVESDPSARTCNGDDDSSLTGGKQHSFLYSFVQFACACCVTSMDWSWKLFIAVDDFITECAIKLGLLLGVLDPEEDFSQYKHHNSGQNRNQSSTGSSAISSGKHQRGNRTKNGVAATGSTTRSRMKVDDGGNASSLVEFFRNLGSSFISPLAEKLARSNNVVVEGETESSNCKDASAANAIGLQSEHCTDEVHGYHSKTNSFYNNLSSASKSGIVKDRTTGISVPNIDHCSVHQFENNTAATPAISAPINGRNKSIGSKKQSGNRSSASGTPQKYGKKNATVSSSPDHHISSDHRNNVRSSVPSQSKHNNPVSLSTALEEANNSDLKNADDNSPEELSEDDDEYGTILTPLVMHSSSASIRRYTSSNMSGRENSVSATSNVSHALAVEESGTGDSGDAGDWAEARKKGSRRLNTTNVDDGQQSTMRTKTSSSNISGTSATVQPHRGGYGSGSNSRHQLPAHTHHHSANSTVVRQSNSKQNVRHVGSSQRTIAASTANNVRSMESSRSNSISSPTSSPATSQLTPFTVIGSATLPPVRTEHQLNRSSDPLAKYSVSDTQSLNWTDGNCESSQSTKFINTAVPRDSAAGACAPVAAPLGHNFVAMNILMSRPPGLQRDSESNSHQLTNAETPMLPLLLEQPMGYQNSLSPDISFDIVDQFMRNSTSSIDARFLQQSYLHSSADGRRGPFTEDNDFARGTTVNFSTALHKDSLDILANHGDVGEMAIEPVNEIELSEKGGGGISSMEYLSNLVNFLDSDNGENVVDIKKSEKGSEVVQQRLLNDTGQASITREAHSLYALSASAPSFQPSVAVEELLSSATTPITPATVASIGSTYNSMTYASTGTPSKGRNVVPSTSDTTSIADSVSTTAILGGGSVFTDEMEIMAGLDAAPILLNPDTAFSPDLSSSRIESYSNKQRVVQVSRPVRSGSDISVESIQATVGEMRENHFPDKNVLSDDVFLESVVASSMGIDESFAEH